MTKKHLTSAVNNCRKFMNENSTKGGVSVEQLKYAVRKSTEKELGITLTEDQWDWKEIVRSLVKTETSTTNFTSFKKFCQVNPIITEHFRDIAGTFTDSDGNSFNYFEYYVSIACHMALVLSTRTEKLSREEIVERITQDVNTCLGSLTNNPLTARTVQSMLPSIVHECGRILTKMDLSDVENMLLETTSPYDSVTEFIETYNEIYTVKIWGLTPIANEEFAVL